MRWQESQYNYIITKITYGTESITCSNSAVVEADDMMATVGKTNKILRYMYSII